MPIIICLLVLKHFSVAFLLPGDGYGSEIVGELCFCSGTELILLLGLLNSRVGGSLLPVHNHMLCFSWCFSVLCCFDEYSPVALCIVIHWIGIIVDSRLVWWDMALQADWYTFHHIVFFDNPLLLLWVRFAIFVLSCVFFFLPLRCQCQVELYYFLNLLFTVFVGPYIAIRCAMWRLLPDSLLWFCPGSSMARVMTCSYVVPVHRQCQWWPIVFSL